MGCMSVWTPHSMTWPPNSYLQTTRIPQAPLRINPIRCNPKDLHPQFFVCFPHLVYPQIPISIPSTSDFTEVMKYDTNPQTMHYFQGRSQPPNHQQDLHQLWFSLQKHGFPFSDPWRILINLHLIRIHIWLLLVGTTWMVDSHGKLESKYIFLTIHGSKNT